MELHGKNLIAGNLSATSSKTFQAFNLALDTPLAPVFYEASKDELDTAVKAARSAFEVYRNATSDARAGFLEKIASEIEALGDSLLQRCHEESALPLARLQGERARTCGQLRLFADTVREGSWVDARIDTALPDRKPLARPDLRRMLQPIGVVGVFGASNFPLAFSVAGGDTASAFAAGCPVVVKGHPAHPGTSELIGGAILRAAAACGLPAGIFSLLHGGPDVSIALVKHPGISAVGFTGSHGAGRALFDAAASRPTPIPVFSEMSSVNPLFILPGALRERGKAIAEGLLGSFTLGVGQFCTKPGLTFLRNSPETGVFLAQLSSAIQAAPRGLMLTPGIRSGFETQRKKLLALPALTQLGATAPNPDAPKTETAPFAASVSAAQFLRQPELAHETFGPFALIILADSEEELTACVQSLEGQLTATLHGTAEDLVAAQALVSVLEQKVGRILVNGFPTGVEVSPAMHHGGPYPATSDARFTSVGTAAILRFARPICYQNFPAALLPVALRNENPSGILRLVNGRYGRDVLP